MNRTDRVFVVGGASRILVVEVAGHPFAELLESELAVRAVRVPRLSSGDICRYAVEATALGPEVMPPPARLSARRLRCY